MKSEKYIAESNHIESDPTTELHRFAEFGKLSAGLFHDLISPLNTLVRHVDQLESSGIQNTPFKRNVTRVVLAIRQMQERLTIIKSQLHLDHVQRYYSINKEIETAIHLLQYRAREAQVTLRFSQRAQFGTYGNSFKLNQIVVNLIANAIDSNDNCARTIRPVVTIGLIQKNTDVILSIQDQGCGIAPEIQSKIFEPFFSTKRRSDGIGIGLSTAQDIAHHEFNSRIKVQSILGKGSTFTLKIPIAHYSNFEI